MIKLQEPIKLRGGKAIVLPDVLADSEPDDGDYALVQAAVIGSYASYIDEATIEQVRESHPRLPVYGLWQLLATNGALDPDGGLQIYWSGDSNGFYIEMAQGAIEDIGQFVGGTIVGRDEDLQSARSIRVDAKRLRWPSVPAKLARERAAERRQLQRRRGFRWAIYAAATAVLFGAVDLGLAGIEASREAKLDRMDQQRARLARDLHTLQSTHYNEQLRANPQSQTLQRLLWLAGNVDYLDLPETPMDAPEWRVVVGLMDPVPTWVETAEPQATETMVLEWEEGK